MITQREFIEFLMKSINHFAATVIISENINNTNLFTLHESTVLIWEFMQNFRND